MKMTKQLLFCYFVLLLQSYLLWYPAHADDLPRSKDTTQSLQPNRPLNVKDLMDLSLNEMLEVKVNTGNITGIERRESPTATTVITKEQILYSQARNLATLLDIYVPGMVLMSHSEGAKIGIRGQIAAENYKLLVLINGRNITDNVYEGVMTEIDMWDMSDIERVEVIRGAGAVTYGSGAVAGVINVITKDAQTTLDKISTQVAHDIAYRSSGASIQYAEKFEKVAVFGHASVRRTLGIENSQYYQMNGDIDSDNRWVGLREGESQKAVEYLADGMDRPQMKFHIGLSNGNNLDLTARYTQAGQSRALNTKTFDNDSSLIIPNVHTHRSYIISPKYTYTINDDMSLESTLNYNNLEYIRYRFRDTNHGRYHSNNIKDYAYSQQRLSAQVLYKYNPGQHMELTTGPEITYYNVGAPWGKSLDHMVVREGGYILSDTINNVYFNDENAQLTKSNGIYLAPGGIKVMNYAWLFETYYEPLAYLKILASVRVDQPSISKLMCSPRLSFISVLDDKNSISVSGQHANRMLPLRAQFIFDQVRTKNQDYEIETMSSLELAYSRLQNQNLFMRFNGYINWIKPVGYTGKELVPQGRQDQAGFDFLVEYKDHNCTIGINHGFLKLLNFDWNKEIKYAEGFGNRNNITYSDYNYIRRRDDFELLLTSQGQDLNNWSNNSTRAYVTYHLLDGKLIWHANARMFWDHKGSYDEMLMYQRAYERINTAELSPTQKEIYDDSYAVLLHEKRLLDKTGAFQHDFKLNMTLSYRQRLSDAQHLLMTIYADNMIGSRRKYYVSTGSGGMYPDRLQFINEPRAVGIRLTYTYQ